MNPKELARSRAVFDRVTGKNRVLQNAPSLFKELYFQRKKQPLPE